MQDRDLMYRVIFFNSREPDMMMGKEEHRRMGKGLTFAVVFAANVGGVATLTGTTPNMILKQYADE